MNTATFHFQMTARFLSLQEGGKKKKSISYLVTYCQIKSEAFKVLLAPEH